MVYILAAYLEHCYKCHCTSAIKMHVRNFPWLPLCSLLRSFNYIMTFKDILYEIEGLFFHSLAEKDTLQIFNAGFKDILIPSLCFWKKVKLFRLHNDFVVHTTILRILLNFYIIINTLGFVLF